MLRTVNGGTVRELVYNGEAYLVELLGPGYSTHPTKIVSVYKKAGSGKVELSYWKHYGQPCIRVYFYKRTSDLSAYTSRGYNLNNIPKRYDDLLNIAASVYADVFGE
jgi:hypothetical protein